MRIFGHGARIEIRDCERRAASLERGRSALRGFGLGEPMIDVHTICLNCCSLLTDGPGTRCGACGYVTGAPVFREEESLEPGTTIGQDDRYFLGRTLGRGGFGVTYLGFDRLLHRRVAIKEFFPADLAKREQGRKTLVPLADPGPEYFNKERDRFLSEARTLTQFNHLASVVSIFDVFTALQTVYIVLEYIPGRTLQTEIEQRKRIPPQEAVHWMVKASHGLAGVHQSKVVHRDVKPANLMLTPQGEIVILDFGSARMQTTDGRYTVYITAGYAPPEAFEVGQPNMGPWMDIYATGATLYALLTGEPPLGAPYRAGGMQLKPFEEFEVSISPALKQCIERAMALEPNRRHPDPRALAEELQRTPEGQASGSQAPQSSFPSGVSIAPNIPLGAGGLPETLVGPLPTAARSPGAEADARLGHTPPPSSASGRPYGQGGGPPPPKPLGSDDAPRAPRTWMYGLAGVAVVLGLGGLAALGYTTGLFDGLLEKPTPELIRTEKPSQTND